VVRDAALATPYRLWVPPTTVPVAFHHIVTIDPARPLLTWYDDRTGDRAELSGATCANWLAKTANLLVDGCGLGPGDTAVVDAPPHWQTAAIRLGCWAAGLVLTDSGSGAGVDVGFATADRIEAVLGRAGSGFGFGLALAPLAAPMREVPTGAADFVVEVRAYGDHFTPATPVAPEALATADLTHRQLCESAADRAAALGIGPGDRVLIDVAAHPDPLEWLLAPLVAGASTVLCGNLDPATLPARTAAERVTVTLSAGRS
jgi:uncharacterized protein (TIGR03089 family)